MQRKQLTPVYEPGKSVPGKAATAVVNEGRFVKVSGDKTADGAYPIVQCVDGDLALGVSENNSADPSTEKASSWRLDVKVNRIGAIVKVAPGENLTNGDLVASDLNGKAKVAATGDWILGQVMADAASTDAFAEVALFNGGISA